MLWTRIVSRAGRSRPLPRFPAQARLPHSGAKRDFRWTRVMSEIRNLKRFEMSVEVWEVRIGGSFRSYQGLQEVEETSEEESETRSLIFMTRGSRRTRRNCSNNFDHLKYFGDMPLCASPRGKMLTPTWRSATLVANCHDSGFPQQGSCVRIEVPAI